MKKRFLLVFLFIVLGTLTYGIVSFTQILKRSSIDLPVANFTNEKELLVGDIPLVSVVAKNLSVPWAIAFLPTSSNQKSKDRRILVTERAGKIKIVDNDNIFEIAEINVNLDGEGGLHGIALDPEFESNSYVYIYYTAFSDTNDSINRVSRYKFTDNSLIDETVILDNIPGARNHNGGRIKFGPNGYLYITTGDATQSSNSQNTSSLAGKILRVDRDGIPALDNPFNNSIYSYGHRNPQGITWDESGQMYSTEHGNSATDEFNMIEIGNNYGWPIIVGNEIGDGMQTPIIQSGSTTWAPSGLAYIDGKFYFGGLRGNALFRIERIGDEFILTEHFKGEFGRIREVIKGPDNMLYITTSNRDSRGIPSENDDRILRINPFIL